MYPKKYSSGGYDVTDTHNDQVYNPSVSSSNISSVSYAVDSIWNYVMLDSQYKLFVGFHCKQYNSNAAATSSAHWAYKYKGALSQLEANELALKGMSWMDICHYYYDKVSGTEHFVSDFSLGPIRIINLTHTHNYNSTYMCDSTGHYQRCLTCGCYTAKSAHVYRNNLCSICSYIK